MLSFPPVSPAAGPSHGCDPDIEDSAIAGLPCPFVVGAMH
ncbi:hypothetical protein Ae168Ps1_0379c [Pseudonocardia sp. Ae168_Ps1]|nr:hypothetical protein Ae150APs1_0384c [Pseudonocardia sp. Ae150A_Ps1]OLL77973.1 hypothetical protein Ae168Ps1_0379c [Pseudonocardia sp. Ae168_Ps1]OLL87904.1 hypothetical protein Ae263Ps1_4959 [Pseudonocardia sp. Ae263_Ps1]OLL92071.1 hypothetical protein Ae356Ps1_1968c [Pseudonocardia sp. Ae356_Ps1]